MGAFVPCLALGKVVSSSRSFTSTFHGRFQSAHTANCPRPARLTTPMMTSSPPTDPLVVMVNGLPGKMATATAEEVVRRGFILAEEALTGSNMDPSCTVAPDASVTLVPPQEHDACLKRVRERHARVVIVDYTHPSAANANVELYARHGLHFVIGTTGGRADDMVAAVDAAQSVYAVIAPNMGKQIVAFQAMMRHMAEQFPTVFEGYTLSVTESHQSTKADTSGTAKAVVQSFSSMGVEPFAVEQIDKVRTKERSVGEMGVPEEAVDSGHAYHTYHLESQDGSVHFEFQHNVCGRGVYAAGTVDAVLFLDGVVREGQSEKRVYNMIDVLRSGTMS